MRAILLDCFGVLVPDGWKRFQSMYFADDLEMMRESTDLQKQFDRGFITYKEFIDSVSTLAYVTPEELSRSINQSSIDVALMNYIGQLSQQYSIGMFSNAGANILDNFFSEADLKLFDAIVLSSETGVIKPEAEAFIIAAARLHVAVDQCIMIDDQLTNCQGAERAGMQSIHYHDLVQLKGEIDAITKSNT